MKWIYYIPYFKTYLSLTIRNMHLSGHSGGSQIQIVLFIKLLGYAMVPVTLNPSTEVHLR